MALTIRHARREDADRVAEFAMKLVDQHVGYDTVRFSRIGNPEGMADFYRGQTEVENASVLVAENEGEVVGFAFMQFEPIIYAELATKVVWLHDIFVDDAERAAGAGKKLMDAVATEAKCFGANKILLSVAAMNIGTQRFFEQTGFVTTMHEMMRVVGD